jgi:bacteriocin-like protein
MQHVEQKKSETGTLTDAELEKISGGLTGSIVNTVLKWDLRPKPTKK